MTRIKIRTTSPLPIFRRNLRSALAWCAACFRRRRERQALALLSDHMLRDIGVDRVDVRRETEKPFWK